MSETENQLQTPDAVDYSRKWYVMFAVGMGVFLATLDGSIVNVAMPTLQDQLDTRFAIVQWVVLSYLLTVTTLMAGVGRLADMIGKKSIYVIGFVVFTVGSVLCALAPTVGWLIGFRVLQALGAAMMMALGAAIVTEAFPASERGRALGVIGLAVSAGIIVGPTLGGVLLDRLSWHWIFLVNLPLGIIGTLVALRFVPATPPQGEQRFDYPGAALLFLSLISLLLALTFGQQFGFGSPLILLLLAGWLLFLVLFIAVEWRVSQPIIDPRLFRNGMFSISLFNGYISFVLIAGVLFLMPFYLENVLGFRSLIVGQLLAILPLTLGITAPLSGWLSDKFGTTVMTVIGLAVLLIGYSRFGLLGTDTSKWGFVLILLPIGIGMGAFQSPNNSAIMGSVPPHQLGVASGLLAITRTLGQTTGIATLNALWASRVFVYAPGVSPDEMTDAPAAAQVAALHDTFFVVVFLIGLALLLSVAGWLRRRWRPLHQAPTGQASGQG
jgi:EmrB/QacA subfamily drug resistance transporter